MRYLTITILLILSLVLAACGGAATSEPTTVEEESTTEVSDEAEATPEPVEDTEETSDAAEETQEADAETESTGEDGEFVAEGASGATLSLIYPEGWLVLGNADDGVIVSTSQDANLSEEAFPSGEATITVSVMPAEILDAMEIEPGTEALEVLTRFLDFIGNEEGERAMPTLGEIQERMMADGNGAYAIGSSEQMDAIIIIMPLGDFYAQISGITASGELPDFEETIFSIAETIVYEPGE